VTTATTSAPRLPRHTPADEDFAPRQGHGGQCVSGGGRPTLGRSLELTWEGLRAAGVAGCPLCGGRMERFAGSGRCGCCGTRLS
jgi:hypothetical protein